MNLNLEPRKIGWVLLAGFACSAIVWGLSVPFTGMREPFDSPTYCGNVYRRHLGSLAGAPLLVDSRRRHLLRGENLYVCDDARKQRLVAVQYLHGSAHSYLAAVGLGCGDRLYRQSCANAALTPRHLNPKFRYRGSDPFLPRRVRRRINVARFFHGRSFATVLGGKRTRVAGLFEVWN